MANKTLIIVDFQYDFANKKGALYVNGAESAEKKIINLLNSNKDINNVIFTMDWHEYCDESFEINGGKWPIHCLQNTIGSGVSEKLVKSCWQNGLVPEFIYKGDCPDTEEYGAFSTYVKDYSGTELFNQKPSNSVKILNNDVIVCGLAGDYCVKETIKNLLNAHLNVEVFTDGIASIDDGTTLQEFMNTNFLTTISL